jgi:hypothetical protein
VIELSEIAEDILTRTYILQCRVKSFLGDEVLSDDIPIAGGSLEIDRSVRVPERLTFTVPRIVDGVSWDPASDADHPLSPLGPTLVVELGVGLPRGEFEWIQRGEYVITETSVDGDTVGVTAVGLLALIDEARFTTPFQPSGTFQTTIRALCEPALTVTFAAGLPTNRAIPTAAINWDEDRLGALYEVLDAWPADAAVDSTGVLMVVPATDSSSPVITLTDGEGGTVMRWAGGASRDGAYSLVVARGQGTDGSDVQGVAYDTDPTSPLRYGGPLNPLPVPFFYFSPLLITTAQCQTAATTILARMRRNAYRMISAACVPHPALEPGDRVTIGNVDGVSAGIIERMSLPLTADGGEMSLTLRVVA